MIEIIKQDIRMARKDHYCDYCNEKISKGSRYELSTLKDDYVYNWKSHIECKEIVQALMEYIDPWDGISSDDFYYACVEFCRTFVCPDCPNWSSEYRECDQDNGYCADKVHAILQTHDLVRSREPGLVSCFKLIPKE